VFGLVSLLGSFAAFASATPATVVARDGAVLKGAWELPASAPRAAALILQGSGNVGMDGDVSGPILGSGVGGAPAPLSAQLAAALSSSGVASLRYDKRGFADPAQAANQVYPYLVSDATDALAQVRARFPGVPVAIVGLSEGAMIAVAVAAAAPADRLFLFAPPSKSIDETMAYQYEEWPVRLLSRLDVDRSGFLSATELSVLQGGLLPLVGAPWASADSNHDGRLSIADELVSAYVGFHGAVLNVLTQPPYAAWFQSMRQAPAFDSLAAKIAAPVSLYQAMDDAQVSWAWTAAAQSQFKGGATLRLYSGLGHCFSPMGGAIGEVKTSGPIDARVLSDFATDVAAVFGSR
jgi:pimeloyl-ACP methyl ester carboxylesterase